MAKKDLPPRSALLRTGKLLRAGLSAAKSEIKQRAKTRIESDVQKIIEIGDRVRREQLETLVKTLGELKGSAMKAGQMLALEAQEFLPPEYHEILTRLYESAPPVSDEVMLGLVRSELGEEKFRQLNLETKSFASASIGQVYRGTLNGDPVVVKVQYPGVSETIDSDINVLRTVVTGASRLLGKSADLYDFFEELKIVLRNETNYTLEVQNMIKYSKFLESDSRFETPTPLEEYCTPKIITMSFLDGLSLSEWVKSNPPKDERLYVAPSILDLFCKEFYENGFVQTDPNLGNFKYNRTTNKIQLLDFGAVLHYSPEFVRDYIEIIKSVYKGDKDQLIKKAIEFRLVAPGEKPQVYDKFYEMMDVSIRPFRPESQPFQFHDRDYTKETRQVSLAFVKSLKKSSPPRHIVFLHRKLGGIYALMKTLEIEMDLLPIWKRIVG